jgi:hypothetical protein
MGGPILIKAREEQCIGAGPCSDPRPMTYEEMLKYYTESEVEEMSKKIAPLEKGQLIEILAEVTGKTKAVHHAADICHVSATVVYGWMKDYGIEFDTEGKVIIEGKAPESEEYPEPKEYAELDKQMQKVAKVVGDSADDSIHLEAKYEFKYEPADIFPKPLESEVSTDIITIAGQETTKKHFRVGYAEYDIGNTIVQIDFRQELVKIGKSNDESLPIEEPISFEEAIAAAELILDILGDE